MTLYRRLIVAVLSLAMLAPSAAMAQSSTEKCRRAAVAAIDTAERQDRDVGTAFVTTVLFGLAGLAVFALTNQASKDKVIGALERNCIAGRVTPAQMANAVATTTPGARRICVNPSTTCSGAIAFCLNNCTTMKRGTGCPPDCRQAFEGCKETGIWKTTNCVKTGMAR